MPSRQRKHAVLRTLSGALVACALFSGAAHASAGTPASEDASAEWVGHYCTPQGCSGSLESVLGNAAGFGAAALGALLLARRRSA